MRDPHFRSVFRVQKWSREVSNFNCEIRSSLLVSPPRSPRIVRLIACPSFLTSSNKEHQTSNQEHQINNLEHQTNNQESQTSNQKHQTSHLEHQTSNQEHPEQQPGATGPAPPQLFIGRPSRKTNFSSDPKFKSIRNLAETVTFRVA